MSGARPSFTEAWRDKRRIHIGTGPGGWSRIQTALAAMTFLWALDLFLVLALGERSMLLGVVLIPVGVVAFGYGWARSFSLMTTGVVLVLVGVIGSFALASAAG